MARTLRHRDNGRRSFAMEADRGQAISELRVDGGAAANQLLLQFQADLLGADVVRPRNLETTALGAAYMAGLAAGVWPDLGSLEDRWSVDRRVSPKRSVDEVHELRAGWNRAIASVRDWAASEPHPNRG